MPDRSHYFTDGGPWSPELLVDWRWLVGDLPFVVSRATAMGSLFVLHPTDGAVLFLDTTNALFHRVAGSVEMIEELPKSPEYRCNLFQSHFVRELRASGMVLGVGQCYGWKLPPCVGGDWELDNIEPTDIRIQVSILGQLWR